MHVRSDAMLGKNDRQRRHTGTGTRQHENGRDLPQTAQRGHDRRLRTVIITPGEGNRWPNSTEHCGGTTNTGRSVPNSAARSACQLVPSSHCPGCSITR